VRFGNGVARGRIGRNTPIRVVDTILTGVHRPGESHFELLEAFVDDPALAKISEEIITHGYQPHEFGDSMLIERRGSRCCRHCAPSQAERR
jgi:S-adenosylmethionine:tRNA ribosyltransferase-isomerase